MSVLRPDTTADALQMLADAPAAVPIAGATDLFVHWPQRIEEHDHTYVDLSRLDALRPMTWTDDTLVLGALTTYWDVLRDARARREFPLLAEAARQVGAVQIQTRGTWAGNIANASPAADGVPVLMAYDAVVCLESLHAGHEVPLAEFYRGYKDMRLEPDQLITAIRIPRRPHAFEIFEKVGSRRAQAITKIGLAITRTPAGWRVVANSMAPAVTRCRAVEQMLENQVSIRAPEDFLPAIRRDVSPIDDIRSTAAYRETVMARLLYADLRAACDFIV